MHRRLGIALAFVLALCACTRPTHAPVPAAQPAPESPTAAVSLETELKVCLSPAGHRVLSEHFSAHGTLETKRQENYYFDTSGAHGNERMLLYFNGLRARLRLEDPEAIFTLKREGGGYNPRALEPDVPEAALVNREEYEATFSDGLLTARRIIAGSPGLLEVPPSRVVKTPPSSAHPLLVLQEILGEGLETSGGTKTAVSEDAVVLVGRSVTERSTVSTTLNGVACELELDRTLFPEDHIGHELELELEDVADRARIESGLRALFRRLDIPYRPSHAGKTSITFMILAGDEATLRSLRRYGTVEKVKAGEATPLAR